MYDVYCVDWKKKEVLCFLIDSLKKARKKAVELHFTQFISDIKIVSRKTRKICFWG